MARFGKSFGGSPAAALLVCASLAAVLAQISVFPDAAVPSAIPPVRPTSQPGGETYELQGGPDTSNTSIAPVSGVNQTRFRLVQGTVTVYTPDDAGAGDTISGTVVLEPAGSTREERAANFGDLQGVVIDIEGQKVPANKPFFTLAVPFNARTSGRDPAFSIGCETGDGTKAGQAQVPIREGVRRIATLLAASFGAIQLPAVGQTSRLNFTLGPHRGGIENTEIVVDGQQARIIAKSPRKCVFESPSNTASPTTILIREGGQETRSPYQNINVKLKATKTKLKTGEKAQVQFDYEGVRNSLRDLSARVETSGAVSMEGGNYQMHVIKKGQNEHTKTEKRTITAQHAGTFNVAATVVTSPYDICLQDEATDNFLLWNSFTGDYILCCSLSGDMNGLQTGQGRLSGAGCARNIQFDSPERRLNGRVDLCNRTGHATISLLEPNIAFDITDPNTGGNVCISPPAPLQPPGAGMRPVAQASPATGAAAQTAKPGPYDNQVVHVVENVGGGGGLWFIKIKLSNGKTVTVYVKGEKPDLRPCNWIRIKSSHTEKGGAAYLDDWDRTDPPEPPPEPMPPAADPKPEPQKPPVKLESIPPELPPPPVVPGNARTTPDPCKEGEKKSARRITECAISESIVTPMGYGPTSNKIFNLGTAILRVVGAGKGVKIGKLLADAFSSRHGQHIYIKIKKKFIDETWVCKNGIWVLESSRESEEETAWIMLYDVLGGGGSIWLPGSEASEADAAINSAKAVNNCP